jgi:hypothetical protein
MHGRLKDDPVDVGGGAAMVGMGSWMVAAVVRSLPRSSVTSLGGRSEDSPADAGSA